MVHIANIYLLTEERDVPNVYLFHWERVAKQLDAYIFHCIRFRGIFEISLTKFSSLVFESNITTELI